MQLNRLDLQNLREWTRKLGETWQYIILYIPESIITVHPPAPLNWASRTVPERTEKMLVPAGAPISIPSWKEEAP